MKTQKSIKSNKAGDLVVDVVVIGGGAGLAAAIASAENREGIRKIEKGSPLEKGQIEDNGTVMKLCFSLFEG